MTKKTVRLKELEPKGAGFVYRAPEKHEDTATFPTPNNHESIGFGATGFDPTLRVKFSKNNVILDEWYLFGGTKWTRFLFRTSHPIVYFKRGLCNLWRRIKRLFLGDPPAYLYRSWMTKEEMLSMYPNKKENTHGTNQTKEHTLPPD